MTNAELIAALRNCSSAEGTCAECSYRSRVYPGTCNGCKWDMMHDAADALEAQQTALDECATQLADMAKRIAELEAQIPKEGKWIWENFCWHCSACGENPTRGMGYVQGKNELYRVCPNCGARMQTVTGCHTLEKGEQ